MATRDQALFLETYLGLRRALKRKSYDSDSDSSIDQSTNRGNKLKKRARFVRQGKLGAADGSAMFTEMVEHAGYRREIISRNPPLVDDDGYEVDSDDDEELIQEAVTNAADDNPYAGIHLEHLLAPLTSVTDLPTHPSLSRPFTSKALTELANQGCNWMHKENRALWKVKPLLNKLCGDHIWVDCKLMLTPDDIDLFDDNLMAPFTAPIAQIHLNGAGPAAAAGSGSADAQAGRNKNKDADTDMKGVGGGRGVGVAEMAAPKVNGSSSSTHAPTPDTPGADAAGHDDDDDADDRRRLDHISYDDGSDDDGGGMIHPLFLYPRAAKPVPNLGLPEHEAEDVRRLLQLWVQKQDEVARGMHKLHEGLMRADRLRHKVLMWSKAEAHCGANRDLSDGEDWYDWDEWRLTEDLKKGHDEDEEELQLPTKKTRNRK